MANDSVRANEDTMQKLARTWTILGVQSLDRASGMVVWVLSPSGHAYEATLEHTRRCNLTFPPHRISFKHTAALNIPIITRYLWEYLNLDPHPASWVNLPHSYHIHPVHYPSISSMAAPLPRYRTALCNYKGCWPSSRRREKHRSKFAIHRMFQWGRRSSNLYFAVRWGGRGSRERRVVKLWGGWGGDGCGSSCWSICTGCGGD